jgi:glucose/arabinose dehydrogenase
LVAVHIQTAERKITMNAQKCSNLALHLACTFLAALFGLPSMLNAQAPSLVDPNLRVRTVIEGLDQPTTMAFLGPNDFFVLEKATGQVKRVVNGIVQSTVLDLAVNSGSERGLLGIALHPTFPGTPTSTCTGRRARPALTPPCSVKHLYWATG